MRCSRNFQSFFLYPCINKDQCAGFTVGTFIPSDNEGCRPGTDF